MEKLLQVKNDFIKFGNKNERVVCEIIYWKEGAILPRFEPKDSLPFLSLDKEKYASLTSPSARRGVFFYFNDHSYPTEKALKKLEDIYFLLDEAGKRIWHDFPKELTYSLIGKKPPMLSSMRQLSWVSILLLFCLGNERGFASSWQFPYLPDGSNLNKITTDTLDSLDCFIFKFENVVTASIDAIDILLSMVKMDIESNEKTDESFSIQQRKDRIDNLKNLLAISTKLCNVLRGFPRDYLTDKSSLRSSGAEIQLGLTELRQAWNDIRIWIHKPQSVNVPLLTLNFKTENQINQIQFPILPSGNEDQVVTRSACEGLAILCTRILKAIEMVGKWENSIVEYADENGLWGTATYRTITRQPIIKQTEFIDFETGYFFPHGELDAIQTQIEKEIAQSISKVEEEKKAVDEGEKETQKPSKQKNKTKNLTINERMSLTLHKIPESTGWKSTEWSKHLDCSRSTVTATSIWKSLEHFRLDAQAERMKDRKRK